jgi:hypothetical protein
MYRNSTHNDSGVHTAQVEHSSRRGVRLVVLVSAVMLWQVTATPSRTCATSDAKTSHATPAFAYVSVTSITLGTRTVTIFWSSGASTSGVRNRLPCVAPPQRATAAENVPS